MNLKNFSLGTNGNNHTFFFVSRVFFITVSLSPFSSLCVSSYSCRFCSLSLALCFLSSLYLVLCLSPFLLFSFSSPLFPSICFTFSLPVSLLSSFSFSSPLFPSICFTFSSLSLSLSSFSPFFSPSPSICFIFRSCLSPFLLFLLLFSLFPSICFNFLPCLSQLSFYLYPFLFPCLHLCPSDCTHLCPCLYICPFLYPSAFHCFPSHFDYVFFLLHLHLGVCSLSLVLAFSLYIYPPWSLPSWYPGFYPCLGLCVYSSLVCFLSLQFFFLSPCISIRVSVSAIQRFSIPVFPGLLFLFGSSFALLVVCLTKQWHFMGCASKPCLFLTHKQTADYLNVHF